MKRVFSVVSVVAVGLALFGTGADARGRREEAKTTITDVRNTNNGPGTEVLSFSGSLFSKRPRCVVARNVEIIQTSNQVKFGEGESGQDGKWTVTGTGPANGANYTIKVHKASRGGVVCRRAETAVNATTPAPAPAPTR
jgi:hypothetical protein